MAVAGLRSGLESLGHRVETWRPPPDRAPGGTALDLRRIAFNLRLRRRFPEGRYDLVVGFDLDGFALPRRLPEEARPPRVTCLKGVAADELRFESGITRARMTLLALLERRAARRAHRVVVPSRYARRRAVDLYGLRPEGTVVVPEGLDPEEWIRRGPEDAEAPEEEGEGSQSPPVILSVARQYRRKDTATLLRAMPFVLTARPGTRLRIVGGGPELPALRRLRAELGLEDRVDLLGALPSRRDVPREYGRADVFCLPSLQEGFGIAFQEAMAAGLPVVACRAGAAPEVVDHGSTGLLCPPGRPRPLARALASLLESPDLRSRMGREGRRRVRDRDWASVARIFLARVTARHDGDGV